jgi:HD-GYP domain-containing protein (c-di-GMP phosphodiesterase class II)
MFDLIRGFSEVVDLVNTTLANHHQRVALITDQVCGRLHMDRLTCSRVVMAAMLHDVGVIPLQETSDSLFFEQDMSRHSLAGWTLLRSCYLLRLEAKIIRYHHISWRAIDTVPDEDREAACFGHLVGLADMIDMHLHSGGDAAATLKSALKKARQTGQTYSQESLAAALELCDSPGFFDNLTEKASRLQLPPQPEFMLGPEDATIFCLLFSHVIDARSPFTATHTSGVAHLVRRLHELAGLPERDRKVIFIAGLLHDIGKVGVPLDLLEKPGKLEPEEFKAVSRHAFLSQQVLSAIPGFEQVSPWGAWHHEKLNGQGYPNGLTAEDIPLESRLTAVADVLTALTEDRPYRPGMSGSGALAVLDRMVAGQAIDGEVVNLVHQHFEDLDETRRQAQNLASHYYRTLKRDILIATDTYQRSGFCPT